MEKNSRLEKQNEIRKRMRDKKKCDKERKDR